MSDSIDNIFNYYKSFKADKDFIYFENTFKNHFISIFVKHIHEIFLRLHFQSQES